MRASKKQHEVRNKMKLDTKRECKHRNLQLVVAPQAWRSWCWDFRVSPLHSAAVQPYRNPLGKKAAAGGAVAKQPAGAMAARDKHDGESPYAQQTLKLLAGASLSPQLAPRGGAAAPSAQR